MPPRNLFPLPLDLSPVGTVCYSLAVPDDSQWKALFWGAVDQLRLWNSYERDAGKHGKDVAAIWAQILDDALSSPCSSGKCFDWKLINFTNGDCLYTVNADGLSEEIPFGDVCLHARIYHGAAISPHADGRYWVSFAGVNDNPDFVGGPIFIVRAKNLTFPNLSDWHVIWDDCSGGHTDHHSTAGGVLESGIEITELCISSSNPFMFYVEVGGNYTCVVP